MRRTEVLQGMGEMRFECLLERHEQALVKFEPGLGRTDNSPPPKPLPLSRGLGASEPVDAS